MISSFIELVNHRLKRAILLFRAICDHFICFQEALAFSRRLMIQIKHRFVNNNKCRRGIAENPCHHAKVAVFDIVTWIEWDMLENSHIRRHIPQAPKRRFGKLAWIQDFSSQTLMKMRRQQFSMRRVTHPGWFERVTLAIFQVWTRFFLC